jgi:RimJ/RimL family protein N-acetyltransferase
MESERLTILPAAPEHLQSLVKGETTFTKLYDRVAEGYIEFPGALEAILEELQTPDAWGTYLFIHREDRTLIGIGGYKGSPDEQGTVEIGYGIARDYRGKGYATEAAQALIGNAFNDQRVAVVIAHTLAETNASGTVLTKCGMRMTAELIDPEDGKIWRWELYRA